MSSRRRNSDERYHARVQSVKREPATRNWQRGLGRVAPAQTKTGLGLEGEFNGGESGTPERACIGAVMKSDLHYSIDDKSLGCHGGMPWLSIQTIFSRELPGDSLGIASGEARPRGCSDQTGWRVATSAAVSSLRGTRRRSGARNFPSQSRQRYSLRPVKKHRIRSNPVFCRIINQVDLHFGHSMMDIST
jgi:hypothetical protein